MKKEFDVIKENLKSLADFEHLNKSILLSQIEEAACLIGANSIDYKDASDIFQDVFAFPLMSDAFMAFCNCLELKGCFKTYSNDCDRDKFKIVSLTDNLYTKDAYQKLSSNVLMSADFENTFTTVCEAVYSKRSDYAILPLFNSHDGLIISIYRLLQKYELKIISAAKVMVNDNENETDFILAGRALSDEAVSYDRIMLSLTHNYDDTISDLLNAMRVIGAFPVSITTLPLEYTDERTESLVTFDISQCRCNAVCAFIKAALPEANVVGIYSYVK